MLDFDNVLVGWHQEFFKAAQIPVEQLQKSASNKFEVKSTLRLFFALISKMNTYLVGGGQILFFEKFVSLLTD